MPRTYVFSVPIGPAHIDRLPQTLKSLAAQSVPVKVALCDASGSAKCKAIADAFPDLIAYRRHGPDKGQSDAINEGWREVEGDVYSWLNADDYLAPDALDIVERAFDDNLQAEIVYGQSLILEEDGTYIGLHPAVSPDIDLITRSNIISQPSCFYKGDLIKALGPVRQELDYTMDWELWVRFFKANKRFAYTPEILSTVLWERGTKTSSVNRQRMSEIRKLTATSHSLYVQMKTMIGFYQHYLAEYSPFAPFFGRLIGLGQTGKARRRRYWQAIDAKTEMLGWSIKFYHFSEHPIRALKLDLLAAASGTVTVSTAVHRFENTKSIMLDLPLHAGEVATLQFEGPDLTPDILDLVTPVF